MMRTHRISEICLVAASSFWLTLGCSSADDGFKFSEADMRSVVAGNWSGSVHGTSETVLLKLAERSIDIDASVATANESIADLRRLQSCGSRQFGNRGIACIAVTGMAIEGQISSSDHTLATSTLGGNFTASGDELLQGDLRLSSTDGNTLTAQFHSGRFENWFYAGLTLDLVKD